MTHKSVRELEKLRKKRGLDKKDVAERIGVTRYTYLNWTNKDLEPKDENKEKIKLTKKYLQLEREIMSEIDLEKMVDDALEKHTLRKQIYANTGDEVTREELDELGLNELRSLARVTDIETNEKRENKEKKIDEWFDEREKLFSNAENWED